MKLFIWTNFCSDYTVGLAFAIAKNEKEARKLVIKDYGICPYNWGNLQILPVNKKIAFTVCGGG